MSDRSRVTTTLHQNDLVLRQDGLRGLWRSSLAHSPPLKLQTSVFGTVVRVRVGAKRAASLYSDNGTHNANTSNVSSVPKSFWYQSLSSRYRRLDYSGAGEGTGPKKAHKSGDTQQKCAVAVEVSSLYICIEYIYMHI
jgi:hypothetical protein